MGVTWLRGLWVDHDLRTSEVEASKLAREALEDPALRAYDAKDLKSDDITQLAGFVADVAKAEQDRETNLNTRGAAVATVAGLMVSVSSAVAKSVFGLPRWYDWTKIAAVALFLAALFAVASAMVIAVVAVLRPKRGPRTKNFLGETLVNLWLDERADDLVHANKDRLNLLFLDRSMRTLPEWHFRNRKKARWLRRSWVFLTIGIVLIAIAAVLVLARVLEVTPHTDHGPAKGLTWAWIALMLGGSASLAGLAVRFDWLGAGRAVEAKKPSDKKVRRLEEAELQRISARLRKSPLAVEDEGVVAPDSGRDRRPPRSAAR